MYVIQPTGLLVQKTQGDRGEDSDAEEEAGVEHAGDAAEEDLDDVGAQPGLADLPRVGMVAAGLASPTTLAAATYALVGDSDRSLGWRLAARRRCRWREFGGHGNAPMQVARPFDDTGLGMACLAGPHGRMQRCGWNQ